MKRSAFVAIFRFLTKERGEGWKITGLGEMGVGGYNGWGARPLPKYRLAATPEYRYKFRMVPIRLFVIDFVLAPIEYGN